MSQISYFETITPPATGVCTLEQLKNWLKIDGNEEDTILTLMLNSSESKIASYINQVLISQTVRGNFNGLRVTQMENGAFISFKRFPLNSISSVEFHDGTNYSILDPSEYVLKQRSKGFARILFTGSTNISVNSGDVAYPIRIQGVAGYADADSVPEPIKIAILMYASHLYSNRGDCSDCACDSDGVPALPKEVRMSLSSFKIQEVFA